MVEGHVPQGVRVQFPPSAHRSPPNPGGGFFTPTHRENPKALNIIGLRNIEILLRVFRCLGAFWRVGRLGEFSIKIEIAEKERPSGDESPDYLQRRINPVL
jgi:hypothetical protein